MVFEPVNNATIERLYNKRNVSFEHEANEREQTNADEWEHASNEREQTNADEREHASNERE